MKGAVSGKEDRGPSTEGTEGTEIDELRGGKR